MRRVYAPPSLDEGRLWVPLLALVAAVGVFLLVPVIQHVSAQKQKQLLLSKADVTQLAPPPMVDTPPPPPPPPEKDEPPPPELADAQALDVPLSVDLDIAVGAGGALAMGGIGGGEDQGALKDLAAFDVTELDRPPELVASVNPVHPSELRKARVEGRVTVVFVVTEEGKVEDLRVESSTRPEFEKPALDAVRRWKFRAGTKENQAVRTNVRQQILFKVRS
jgi:protein TonB